MGWGGPYGLPIPFASLGLPLSFLAEFGGSSPPAPPANPRAGSPQAPPPFSHAPFLNGAPPAHQPPWRSPREGWYPPNLCACVGDTQTPSIPRDTHPPSHWAPPPRLTGSSLGWLRRNAGEKFSSSRPLPVVFLPREAPPVAPAAAQGCSTRGRQALTTSQAQASPSPRRARGRQQTLISCLRSACDESLQFYLPGFLRFLERQRAETLGLFGKHGYN